ncbi:MAG: hypothetical protein KGH60_02920 [Candidatus Micrarchaeota archaeon]|nr:hypothetical protein [Candidatus Micrarchaeota archaeon]
MLMIAEYISYVGIRLGFVSLCIGLALWLCLSTDGQRRSYGFFYSGIILLTASALLQTVVP